MTTPYMRSHGDKLPVKKIRTITRVVKKVVTKYPPAMAEKKQADELLKALGWTDNKHWNAMALGAVQALHDQGYRIVDMSPKHKVVSEKIAEWQRGARLAQPSTPGSTIAYGDGNQA